MFEYGIVKDSAELRKAISENPDLPIFVLANECSWDGDHAWTYCLGITVSVEEILDCEVPYMETVETDRDSFNEQIEEWLWDNMCEEEFGGEGEPSERYFQERLAQEKAKYDPYWKKGICIYATN